MTILERPIQSEILYPYALNSERTLIFIENVERDDKEYICPGCNQPMIARLGKIRVHHFAHKASTNVQGSCNGETALHMTAKYLLKQRFENHTLSIEWCCDKCKHFYKWMGGDCDTVDIEQYFYGVKPDALFSYAGQPRYVIEVAVTHDTEPESLIVYRKERLPVLVWRPTWDSIQKPVFITEIFHRPFLKCPHCIKENEKEDENREKIKRIIRHQLMVLRNEGGRSNQLIKVWDKDRAGNPIQVDRQFELTKIGSKAISLGFYQSNNKPYLFTLNLEGYGLIFLDLGGTKFRSIYDNYWRPILYNQINDHIPYKKLVVDVVVGTLRGYGLHFSEIR